MNSGTFNLWVFGDAHVGTDLKRGRESLADALCTSERGGIQGGPPFDWDIAIDVGDMSGGQSVPEDQEGEEVVRQFRVLEKHPREAVYSVCGNHDRSGLDEPGRGQARDRTAARGVRGLPFRKTGEMRRQPEVEFMPGRMCDHESGE